MNYRLKFAVIVLAFVSTQICSRRLLSEHCLEKPDYSKCQLKSSCNPTDTNPCGCPHACCAPDTSNREKYDSNPQNDALPFLYGYKCYKKPLCGDKCFRDGLCPCETNLKCMKSLGEKKTRRCY